MVNLFCVLHLLPFGCREYSSRFELADTTLFCLRVMVGVIILYDHIHPVGAFAKTTNIDVSVCVCVHARVCVSVCMCVVSVHVCVRVVCVCVLCACVHGACVCVCVHGKIPQ